MLFDDGAYFTHGYLIEIKQRLLNWQWDEKT